MNRPSAAELVAIAASLGVAIPPPRPAKCPASGPQSLLLYATMDALNTASGGLIGSDGRVAVTNPESNRVTLLDLTVIDQLRDLKWIEEPDAVSLRLTEKGRWWLAKFYRQNGYTR